MSSPKKSVCFAVSPSNAANSMAGSSTSSRGIEMDQELAQRYGTWMDTSHDSC